MSVLALAGDCAGAANAYDEAGEQHHRQPLKLEIALGPLRRHRAQLAKV